MNEAIEAAKRHKTSCNYDLNRNCKECAYHIPDAEMGMCYGDETDVRLIVDFILNMEDDGK